MYFAGVMVRLMLTLTPVVCVLSGIAFSKLFEVYLKVSLNYYSSTALFSLLLTLLKVGLKYTYLMSNYASPSSGDAYRDWQLTLNFELWVENFACRHVSMWGLQNCAVCPSLSVCPEKRNHPSFINISRHFEGRHLVYYFIWLLSPELG